MHNSLRVQWVPIDDGEYDVAKWYLNITLREMQAATLCALKSAKAILEEKHEATSAS